MTSMIPGATWTNETPTVPGFYWMQSKNHYPLQVVEIRATPGGGDFQVCWCVPVLLGRLVRFTPGLQWAGPIPEPTFSPTPPIANP